MPVAISALPNLATLDGALDKLPVFDASGALTGKASPNVITRAGLLAAGALDFGTNNVTNAGTYNGRDVAADGTLQDTHLTAGGTRHAGAQISNGSGVSGATVDDALDTIAGLASFMVPLYDLVTLLPVDVEITESAGNIVCTLTDDAGALFVTGRWAGDSHTLTTPATVNLTAGTVTVLQTNYVFLTELSGTVTLGANTTGFPADSIHLATVAVQTSTEVATHGPIGLHIHNDDPTEHIQHLGERIRANHAQWHEGVAGSISIVSGPSPDDVYFASTSGHVYQMHEKTVPAFNMATGTVCHVMNDPTTPWVKITNLNTALTDSAGGSMSGRYFSIVFVVIPNQDSGESKLVACLPSGSYGSSNNLIADASKFAAFAIPAELKGNAVLVTQALFRHQTAGGGQWTLIETRDLRGLFPGVAAGGSVASGTEFDDSVFRVNDDGDNTKQLAFQVSGVAAATLRTITMPDADVDLALVAAHASRHITGGADEIDGDQLDIDFTPSNYTPSIAPAEATDVNHMAAHLSGIDTALAGVGGGSAFADSVFRVQDNADATKEIALEASAITTGTTRTITMPDTDVALADIATNTAHAGTGGATHADVISGGADGFMTGADKTLLDTVVGDAVRTGDAAGGGLGGAFPNPSVDGMTSGVLANDAAHGVRGGGTQHADAIAAGASGFMTGADKTAINAAIVDGDFTGSTIGEMTRTGAGAYVVLQHNITAAVAPGVSDDGTAGYAVGSLWIDTTAGNVYRAVSVGTGTASWQHLNAAAGAGAIVDGDFAGTYRASMIRTGSGAYAPLKRTDSATTDPGVSDDGTADWVVGSIWINTTADTAWVCLDSGTGAAVWTEITQAGGGGGGPTTENISAAGPTTIGGGDRRVLCDSTSALIGLTLPTSPTIGDRITVLDDGGEAHMTRITITRAGSQLINGETTIVVDIPYGEITLTYTDTDVWVATFTQSWDRKRVIDIHETFSLTPTPAGTVGSPYFASDSGSGGNINSTVGAAGVAGLVTLDTDTSATGRAGLAAYGHTSGVGIRLDDGPSFFEVDLRIPLLSTVTEEFKLNVGFGQEPYDDNPDPGAFFEYDRGTDIDWRVKTAGGAETATDTTEPVTASATVYTRLRVAVNADGTEVVFIHDGVIVATHTTNIPSGTMCVRVGIFKTAGTTLRSIVVDRVHYHKVLT